jgi:hypothetical protein
MEKHKATRNTAFTNAPNTSARAQPNVFFDHFFGDICKDKPLLYIYKTYKGKQELYTDYTEVMMELQLPQWSKVYGRLHTAAKAQYIKVKLSSCSTHSLLNLLPEN